MFSAWTTRRLAVDGLLVWAVVTGVLVAAHPSATAAVLGLGLWPWTNRLFDAGLLVAFVTLCLLALRLLSRLAETGRRWRDAGEGQRSPATATAGTVAVEFILVLPVVLLIMGMIIQMALLANASLVVRYAAFAAARTAIVRFEWPNLLSPKAWLDLNFYKETIPSQGQQEVRETAYLILATISPNTGGGGSELARAIQTINNQQGRPWGSRVLEGRWGYASDPQITTVTIDDSWAPLIPDIKDLLHPVWQSLDKKYIDPWRPHFPDIVPEWVKELNKNPFVPRQVEVTVQYKFRVTIPGLAFATEKGPGGKGQVFTIEQRVRLQSVGSRQASPLAIFPYGGNSPKL